MIRKAVVAGRFYPGARAELSKALNALLSHSPVEEARAILAPHAGYVFSGAIAGQVYSSVRVPDRVVLIGPNHTGLGPRASVMASGCWEIPLGRVKVDTGAAEAVLASTPLFSADTEAHLMEHSIEVQLPFIYVRNPDAMIVPITVMQGSAVECEEMGRAIAGALSGLAGQTLIVASTDMNHFEPDGLTRAKDKLAIDKVLALDARGLLKAASENDITMCGVVPSAITIFAARELGAKKARLVSYATSGDVNGDLSQVVGYAGVIIT